MENQHKKIKGYRDLSQEEIDLMNEIKEHAEKTKELISKVSKMREHDSMYIGVENALSKNQISESNRSLAIAKTKLQTGFMWFVRAVALPDSF